MATQDELLRQSNEMIELARRKMQSTQDKQKQLANQYRQSLRLTVGQLVLLKVTPSKGGK